MKTISFFNVKGGVGKTTSSINVGYNLSQKGKRVLIIDLDPQANITDFFDQGQYNTLTIKDVFDETCSLHDAIQKTAYTGLDVVGSTIILGRTEKIMTSNTTEPQQFKLTSCLKEIKDDYDYVIFDCRPSAEDLININGLTASNLVLIPMRPNKWAVQGLQYSLETIRTVRRFSPYELSLAAYLNETGRTNISRDAFNVLKSDLGDKLLDVTIPKATAAEQSSFAKIPLAKYDPESMVSKKYIALTDKIIELMKEI